jgi:protein ImuA
MQGNKAAALKGLRSRIAAIERRPVLVEVGVPGALERMASPFDLIAAPTGLLQEIFTDDQRNSGASLGFALGMAGRLITPLRPALLYLQLAVDTQEIGLPYAPGFGPLGLEPADIVIGRIETVTELLWAMEEAIACQAIAAVIADIPGENKTLDFTVSRRLNLRSSAAHTSAFMLRYGTEREASAAKLRWKVSPAISAAPFFDPQAPGPPSFSVMLEKSRLGLKSQRLEGQNFELDWMDHGFVIVERGQPKRTIVQRPAPASRLEPAELGNGLSQAS